MDAQIIRGNIRSLVADGHTCYENCEKLVLLHKALKCLEEYPAAADTDSGEDCPLTKAQISSWVGAMENADGTHGGHWAMEQTEQFRKQRNIDCNPVMFYAAINMMYSDYCKAAEKMGINSVDFYAYMAKAFLDDKDASPNKLARYYQYIVGK